MIFRTGNSLVDLLLPVVVPTLLNINFHFRFFIFWIHKNVTRTSSYASEWNAKECKVCTFLGRLSFKKIRSLESVSLEELLIFSEWVCSKWAPHQIRGLLCWWACQLRVSGITIEIRIAFVYQISLSAYIHTSCINLLFSLKFEWHYILYQHNPKQQNWYNVHWIILCISCQIVWTKQIF